MRLTRAAKKAIGEEVIFLTVMTSASHDYNDHATVATAKAWAANGLDPDRVVAAKLWAKTIPEHRMYSPEGHTLFVHVGVLTTEQIQQVFAHYKKGWDAWKKTAELADWMSER